MLDDNFIGVPIQIAEFQTAQLGCTQKSIQHEQDRGFIDRPTEKSFESDPVVSQCFWESLRVGISCDGFGLAEVWGMYSVRR